MYCVTSESGRAPQAVRDLQAAADSGRHPQPGLLTERPDRWRTHPCGPRLGSPQVFVNNVSFGLYADALLGSGYREDKARTLAAVAPPYFKGRQCVEADVDTPRGAVRLLQVVLVSNSPHHIATPRYQGRRFTLTSGLLGGIVLKRPTDTPPDLFRHLRGERLWRQSDPGMPGDAARTHTPVP